MASENLNPLDHPEEWDCVTIGGDVSPGICKLSGFKREFGWEIKKGKGARGSTVTLNEYPPVEGTITFSLWEPEHFDQWADFRENFKYDPTKKPISAIEIFHPSLADIGIASVVCKSISAIEPQGQGMFTITVALIEYNPPPKKSAVATPDGAKVQKDGGSPGTQPDPIADAQQKEIQKLKDELAAP